MKKSLFLIKFFCLLLMSINSYAQIQLALPKSKDSINCVYGKRVTLGFYASIYDDISFDSLDMIQRRLNKYLKMDINTLRLNGDFDLWCILMRTKDIKWGSKQDFVLNYLHSYAKTILSSKSFLNKENRNTLLDEKGCSYYIDDALFVPQNCYWVILNIDKSFYSKSVEEIWAKLLIDEPYFNQMRRVLLNEISKNHKDKSIQTLIENLKKKYESQKIFVEEKIFIQELSDRNLISKTKSQASVWIDLIKKSKPNTYELMSSDNLEVWSNNAQYVIDVFDETQVEIPLSLAEKEKDLRLKYCLAYCCCGLVNRKYPKKIDPKLLQRIDKLVLSIQKHDNILKTGKKGEDDFLNFTYQVLKTAYKQ